MIIVDNATPDAAVLVDLASTLPYSPIGPYYPGLRTLPDAEFRLTAIAAVGSVIDAQNNEAAREWSGECYFSIVTSPPAQLKPIQRFPHYDGVEEHRYAALLFLCGSEFGGTAFYRHLSTGYETVNAERFPSFKSSLECEVRQRGLPPQAYITDGAPYFEKIAEFDAASNRMLLYRGKALHCSAIRRPELLTPDPRRGRLTLNLFLAPRSSPQ